MDEQASPDTSSRVSGKRRIVIITGLSGAGKSNALQAFEDAGYFCIDNLPPRMIPAVMETTAQGNGGPDGVVVVVDMRGRRYFGEELERNLEAVEKEDGWEHSILFIDSDVPTLVRRYKESRRPHPAARNGDVLEAIRLERRDLANVREMADLVVDTSGYSALDTRLRFKKLAESFSSRMTVSLISFGFKHGTPSMWIRSLTSASFPTPTTTPSSGRSQAATHPSERRSSALKTARSSLIKPAISSRSSSPATPQKARPTSPSASAAPVEGTAP